MHQTSQPSAQSHEKGRQPQTTATATTTTSTTSTTTTSTTTTSTTIATATTMLRPLTTGNIQQV